MSETVDLSDRILEEKLNKIIPGNIKKDVQIFDVEGSYEGSTVEGAKIFNSIQEMDASTGNVEGDLAIVYRDYQANWTESTKASKINFPDTVILPEALIYPVYSGFRSEDSSYMFYGDLHLYPEEFEFQIYTEDDSYYIIYTSSDGITYTKSSGPDNIDLGFNIYCEYEWSDDIGYFLKIDGKEFNGLYIFTDNQFKIAENQFNLDNSNQLLPDVKAYGKTGVITGDNTVYNNIPPKIYLEQIFGESTWEDYINNEHQYFINSVSYSHTLALPEKNSDTVKVKYIKTKDFQNNDTLMVMNDPQYDNCNGTFSTLDAKFSVSRVDDYSKFDFIITNNTTKQSVHWILDKDNYRWDEPTNVYFKNHIMYCISRNFSTTYGHQYSIASYNMDNNTELFQFTQTFKETYTGSYTGGWSSFKWIPYLDLIVFNTNTSFSDRNNTYSYSQVVAGNISTINTNKLTKLNSASGASSSISYSTYRTTKNTILVQEIQGGYSSTSLIKLYEYDPQTLTCLRTCSFPRPYIDYNKMYTLCLDDNDWIYFIAENNTKKKVNLTTGVSENYSGDFMTTSIDFDLMGYSTQINESNNIITYKIFENNTNEVTLQFNLPYKTRYKNGYYGSRSLQYIGRDDEKIHLYDRYFKAYGVAYESATPENYEYQLVPMACNDTKFFPLYAMSESQKIKFNPSSLILQRTDTSDLNLIKRSINSFGDIVFDFQGATYGAFLFCGCANLKEYPKLINTSGLTQCNYMFAYNYQIDTFPDNIDLSGATTLQYAFVNCNYINFPIIDLHSASYLYNTWSGCDNLSNQSLQNIMQICINGTSVSGSNRKLSYLGFSNAQIEICKTLPNYSNFVAAGWSAT